MGMYLYLTHFSELLLYYFGSEGLYNQLFWPYNKAKELFISAIELMEMPAYWMAEQDSKWIFIYLAASFFGNRSA